MTVQNQKRIRMATRVVRNANNLYSTINIDALQVAMQNLKGETFKLWMYLNKNTDKLKDNSNYEFDLSQVAAEAWGIKKDAYYSGVKKLIELGYLTQLKDGSNIYIFRESLSSEVEISEKPKKVEVELSEKPKEFSEKPKDFSEIQKSFSEKPKNSSEKPQRNNTNNTIIIQEQNNNNTGLSQQAAPTITKEKEQDSESAAAAITYWTKDKYVMWSLYHRQDPLPENLYVDGIELNKFLLRGRA